MTKFTADEALVIAASMRGVTATEEHARVMWMTVEDTIADEKLDAIYGIDGAALIHRLVHMPQDELLELLRILEQDIWFGMDTTGPRDMTGCLYRLQVAGLVL